MRKIVKRTTGGTLKAKKSLGQNFLKNKGVLQKITDAANLVPGETVLEIGPGEGNLTEKLLAEGARVVAVEKDDRLIPILQQKFSAEILRGKFELVHNDILCFNPSNYALRAPHYIVVANIPYYITGQLIRKLLSEWPQPSRAVLLVQKEVAEKIVARGKKESLLSTSVKIYGNPKIISTVKAGSFTPMPKVDSAILVIENISKNNLKNIDEQKFFEIVKAGFAHKRKLLAGNLKKIFGEKTEQVLENCGVQRKTRAENLTLENWICLQKHTLQS